VLQPLECRHCGDLMELRTIRASHPADDEHFSGVRIATMS
jgi:hypothetical protein